SAPRARLGAGVRPPLCSPRVTRFAGEACPRHTCRRCGDSIATAQARALAHRSIEPFDGYWPAGFSPGPDAASAGPLPQLQLRGDRLNPPTVTGSPSTPGGPDPAAAC